MIVGSENQSVGSDRGRSIVPIAVVVIFPLFFFSVFFFDSSMASGTYRLFRFKECIYTPTRCSCCEEIDVIYKFYKNEIDEANQSFKGRRAKVRYFLGHSSNKYAEHIVVILVHSRFYNKMLGGRKTIVLKKQQDNTWMELLNTYSTGTLFLSSRFVKFQDGTIGTVGCYQSTNGRVVVRTDKEKFLQMHTSKERRCLGISKKEELEQFSPYPNRIRMKRK